MNPLSKHINLLGLGLPEIRLKLFPLFLLFIEIVDDLNSSEYIIKRGELFLVVDGNHAVPGFEQFL